MPSTNASTDLSLPPSIASFAALMPVLNDRMRQIEGLTGSTAKVASSTGGGTSTATGSGQVGLSVPGTLGMKTTAAPLLLFGEAVTPSALVAIVAGAAIGASIIVQIMVGGVSYAQITTPAGMQSPNFVSVPGAGTIPANTVVTLNLISVGTTFPGSGLSVFFQGV